MGPRQRRLGGLYVELNGDHEIAPSIAACPVEGPKNGRENFGWRRYSRWRLGVRPFLVPAVSVNHRHRYHRKWARKTRTLCFDLRRFFQNFQNMPRAAMMTPMTATVIPP